jgi:hypothetical protein
MTTSPLPLTVVEGTKVGVLEMTRACSWAQVTNAEQHAKAMNIRLNDKKCIYIFE